MVNAVKNYWKLIGLVLVLLLTAPQYSQFMSKNFWFSINVQSKVDRSIKSILKQLPEGRIAGTSRSLANFGYNRDILNLDYWAVPYSVWPEDVSGAVIPTDIGSSKEWALNNLSDSYLLIRGLLETKGFKYLTEENGYQLWGQGNAGADQPRLFRSVPASILESNIPLQRDEQKQYYRKISVGDKKRLIVYGPYVNLIPGLTGIKINAKVINWVSGNLFHFDLMRDGIKIFEADLSYDAFVDGEVLLIPEKLILESGKYEFVIHMAPDYLGDPILFYGLEISTENNFLKEDGSFYVRLNKDCEAELPHYMLSGQYKVMNFDELKVVSKSHRGIKIYPGGTFELYNNGQRDKVWVNFSKNNQCESLAYIHIKKLTRYSK